MSSPNSYTTEAKFKVGDQWYYRGNKSPRWFYVASRADGSCQDGICEMVPGMYWPYLEEIARLSHGPNSELEENNEPLREMCINYRNSHPEHAENYFQRIVRFVMQFAVRAGQESHDNGYEAALEIAARHVEAQHCVWDHTQVPIAHILQTLANNIRALKNYLPRDATKGGQ